MIPPQQEPEGRAWAVAGLLAVGAALAVLAVFSPRFVVWRGLGIAELQVFPEVNRAGDALRQLSDPFGRITNPSNRVIEWRLLFPLLGRALQVPERLYLAWPMLGCLGALAYAARALRARGWRYDEVFAALIVLGASPWFFVSTGWLAYFDSWIVLALLLCTLSPSRGVVAGVVLLAPWIDERFLFVLPACLLAREGLRRGGVRERLVGSMQSRMWGRARSRLSTSTVASKLAPTAEPPTAPRADLETGLRLLGNGFGSESRRDWTLAAVALLPFVLIRSGAALFGPARDTVAVLETAGANLALTGWRDYAAGAWQGLRFGWVAVGGLAWWSWRRSPRLTAATLAAAGLALVAMFALAADTSRSAATLAPLVGVAFAVGWPAAGRLRRGVVWLLAALNLAAPAAHVVNNTRVELRALPHEVALWRNPPELLRADPYNLRATLLLVEGRAAEALALLDQALQLEPAFQPAQINRSTALGRLGRWPEALVAAERALVLDDSQVRAWYARAQAREQIGNLRGALADAEQALALTPPADPLRARLQTLAESLRRRL